MRPFPFALTDDARDYLVRTIEVLRERATGDLPRLAELCWRSGSAIDAGSIETFGICAAETLDLNTLEVCEIDGKPIRISATLQERYRGRLLTVGTRADPDHPGTRLRELYFL